ncbi:isocitrate dehydrogenase kinase/phosphatase [Luminiphilus syltensis NOR5-1B]|uniref:Isocitrate dehydrogenase kinase/phosphatase n=1 Tax=Luminiphilus syltensis NOR5-1B TaxID=565045 RepID=B8KWV4_9GAMM|nr:bifunctional isocitrate dehydrogenase kinase/phosphatase [Luminiphilus syltensis]EED35831.1 isocitrate dehydrogenase kinase/phosphatase [Luminiphilus syltensis NOR5-1B]
MDKQIRLARTILNGFEAYFAEFENITLAARTRFENGEWAATHEASTRRIDVYKEKVLDVLGFVKYIAGDRLNDRLFWSETREVYAGLVRGMTNFEIAETFYNSVYNAIFGHQHIRDDYAFVFSPQGDMPPVDVSKVVRRYSPTKSMSENVRRLLEDYALSLPYEDMERDVQHICDAIRSQLRDHFPLDADTLEVQLLEHHFFRNKAVYIVGRIVAGGKQMPFVIPMLHNGDIENPAVYIDAALFGPDLVSMLFSFTRTYFMVDASIPSQYVLFLQQLMPKKAISEIYSAIGHHRHGKTFYYRSACRHMQATTDSFVVAPGIKGMVMTVFTLQSYEFVFKIIKDRFTPPKEVTHELVREKYQLVKRWDRAGRMADTQEFTNLVFERARFSDELMQELHETCPSQIVEHGTALIIKHCYVERRMTPLNLYLQTANDDEVEAVMLDYGKSIKELAAANIFPGDMLLKNFGVTRHGRVVFYDYDEIEPLLKCNFRRIPPPRDDYEEMASQPWYSVGPYDIFPEEFRLFFSGNQRARKAFDAHHSDIYDVEFWHGLQERLRAGHVDDFIPYPQRLRFSRSAA